MQSELQAKAVEEKQKELEVEIQKLQEKANEGILKLEMLPHGDTAEAYFLVHSGTIEIAMISLTVRTRSWVIYQAYFCFMNPDAGKRMGREAIHSTG